MDAVQTFLHKLVAVQHRIIVVNWAVFKAILSWQISKFSII